MQQACGKVSSHQKKQIYKQTQILGVISLLLETNRSVCFTLVWIIGVCYILSCGREMRMVAKQRTYRYSQ